MKQLVTICLLFFFLPGFSQTVAICKATEKKEFIGRWILSDIRNGANKVISDQVQYTELLFGEDSVFIITGEKTYQGTWTFANQQIQINIEGVTGFNYKWAIKSRNSICFRQGDDMSRLECFKKEN